jgi:hypothetical protein
MALPGFGDRHLKNVARQRASRAVRNLLDADADAGVALAVERERGWLVQSGG